MCKSLCPLIFAALVAVATSEAIKSAGSGVEQFWKDDYKAFENLYSRTSDKDLFGKSAVPTVLTYPALDVTSQYSFLNHKKQLDKEVKEFGDLFDSEEQPYGDRYIRLLAEQQLKSFDKTKPKPGSKFFTNSYFKPINKKNNPDLYNYLESLETFERKKKSNLNVKKDNVKLNSKPKRAFLYNAPPKRCGKAGCKGSKRPSKIALINGPYVKRVRHRIVHY